MRDAIYTALVNDHPEQIQKIERTNDGWNNYWNEVLQSAVLTIITITINNMCG
jgi:hypothetical protein